MTNYILAHDLGTTGNKANLFDTDGTLVGSAFAGYETAYPQPNWAEQNPDDWWQALCSTTRQLLAKTGVKAADIAGVGFSGQMMGCVPVDAKGQPLRSCIIWADQRAQAEADQIGAICGEAEVYQRTGHRVSPAYTAAKILWLRNHDHDIYTKTRYFLQPKDYIVYRLTGEFATDYSDASGTLLFDLTQRTWHRPFLDKLDLSGESQLPKLHPSNNIVGHLTSTAAQATGLAINTPVVIGGGDGACAGVGAGVVNPGDAYCYIGSSSWISMSSAAPILDPQQRTFTFHHLHPDYYCPMGTMQAAGGARDWAWDLLGSGDADLDAAAAQVAPSANGLLFLPYLLGERSPHWNPAARAAFVGLAMPDGKAEMARAVMEGVALNLRLILDTLRTQVSDIDAIRLIGGGGKSALWPQILADCFNLPIHSLSLTSEATAWGAAVATGVAMDLYDWTIAAECTQVVDIIEPRPSHVALYDELTDIFYDAYLALEPIFERLVALPAPSSKNF